MKAIIAAGGSGTRLRPLTFSANKHVLPVANKPLLLYAFESVVETGITEIGVIVNQTKPAIEALLGDGSRWGVKVTYIDQPQALGLAHVVKISKEFLDGDSFVYHLGDNIFTKGIMKPFKTFVDKKPAALLTMVEHEENYRLGVPYFDEQGALIKVVEKPENPPHKFAVPGLYFFSNAVFEAFEGSDAIKPSARGELEVTDLYSYLIDHGQTVLTESVDGQWMDPGKFVDMLTANAYLLEEMTDPQQLGSCDKNTSITGSVEIGSASTITNATIIGPVSIGNDVQIANCTIGPNVSIDNDCVISGATIENSIVMQRTEIKEVSHKIVDSLIGRDTQVWEEKQESVSLFIGDNCKVRLT